MKAPFGIEGELPTAIVDGVVVSRAKRDEVVEVGCPAVLPFLDVVGLAPGDRPIATVPGTAAVEGVESGPLRCGGGA